MARYATSQGKGPKKNKRRDKLKASVHVDAPKGSDKNSTKRRVIHKINDGDPTVYTDGHVDSRSKKAANPNLIRRHTKSGEMSKQAALEKVRKKYK